MEEIKPTGFGLVNRLFEVPNATAL